jgi:predicted aspartyl protease
LTKTNAFLISLLMFFLGFSVSEFLSDRNLQQDQKIEPGILANTKKFALEDKVVLLDDVFNSPRSQGAATVEQPEEFSWQQVQQLIASEYYEKAINVLEKYLVSHENSAQAWFLLAHSYQRQNKPTPALNAWLRYFQYETDSSKISDAFTLVRDYVLRLAEKPDLYGGDQAWLMAQLSALLDININDGELHLVSAALFLDSNDSYQAQYHALMAVNDPLTQKRAEALLEKLNEKETPDEMVIPLTRYGHQYLVDVFIEGHSARLLLDTGASISGISSVFAEKFSSIVKAKKPIRLNTASGTVDSYLFTVNQITISNLAFNQHILALLPMGAETEIDGLLGVDIIGRFDFVIDQDALVLKLRKRAKS